MYNSLNLKGHKLTHIILNVPLKWLLLFSINCLLFFFISFSILFNRDFNEFVQDDYKNVKNVFFFRLLQKKMKKIKLVFFSSEVSRLFVCYALWAQKQSKKDHNTDWNIFQHGMTFTKLKQYFFPDDQFFFILAKKKKKFKYHSVKMTSSFSLLKSGWIPLPISIGKVLMCFVFFQEKSST